MRFHRLWSINRRQKGFTLIELMIAMAISGIIAAAVTMTMFQIVDSSGRTSNHMTAVRQVQSAGYWVSSDAQMAQVVTTSDPDGFPLTLTWTEWEGEVNVVTYTIVNGELKRSLSVNGGLPSETIVAQFIESIEVSPRPYTGGKLTFTVTVQVGAGSAAQTETRIYEVTPRPG